MGAAGEGAQTDRTNNLLLLKIIIIIRIIIIMTIMISTGAAGEDIYIYI